MPNGKKGVLEFHLKGGKIFKVVLEKEEDYRVAFQELDEVLNSDNPPAFIYFKDIKKDRIACIINSKEIVMITESHGSRLKTLHDLWE